MKLSGIKIIDLKDFLRWKYPPPVPEEEHPIRRSFGKLMIRMFEEYAINFYQKGIKTTWDDLAFLQSLQKDCPHQPSYDYTFSLRKGRQMFMDFSQCYSSGLLKGIPYTADVRLTDSIKIRVKANLLAKRTREAFLIKSFSLRLPLEFEMVNIYWNLVGLSLAYPPPWRLWAVGFSSREIQYRIIEPAEEERQKLKADIIKYCTKKEEKMKDNKEENKEEERATRTKKVRADA